MGNRRFAQVSTSDEEDEPRRRRKKVKLSDEEEEERTVSKKRKGGKRKKKKREDDDEHRSSEDVEEEEEETPQEDAKPIGEPVKLTGKGRGRRSHFEAFEFDGNRYELEDPVLLVPEDKDQKPYVAIIKDIAQTKDGSMMVTGQWFYRPEEAERKGGGNWQSTDTRELFYSFHRDEVPAESVMHKCVVHFVPINKQLPIRQQNPGFIVQKVYDTVERKLWKLTDKDYEDRLQHEIDLLVQKTISRLGDLPDIVEAEEPAPELEDSLKNKRLARRRNIPPLDVSRDDDATPRPGNTPVSCTANASEESAILSKFNALTGETHRDRWLEKLLQGIQYMCKSAENINGDDKERGDSDGANHDGGKFFLWPDDAVPAVSALEKASHDALSSDFQKYNQKMRQLVFNMKNNSRLARRLLNGELGPSKILNMTPTELKEGLTAEETTPKEPEESTRMQMTDAHCSRCNEKKVGLTDIIQAGHGDRYQLECVACGYSWYASRDEASAMTIEAPTSARSVGTAPWATSKFENVTSKFENVEKKLVSPTEDSDAYKRTTEAYMPILDTQKAPNKSKAPEDNTEPTKNG